MVRTKGKLPDALGNAFILFINAVPSAVYYLFIQFAGTKLLNIGMLYKEGDISTWILPVISMSLGSIASYAMWTRRYMMDQINSDYVKLARAKGLTDKQIMVKHVLRNAFAPMAPEPPILHYFHDFRLPLHRVAVFHPRHGRPFGESDSGAGQPACADARHVLCLAERGGHAVGRPRHDGM